MTSAAERTFHGGIIRADGDQLFTADGHTLIDLFTAHGTTWLGHGRREVREALARQLDQVWITGGHPTPAVQAARTRIDAFLPEGYTLATLSSTGMEANEQAYRIARVHTGRHEALGFEGAMHGKSFATAALAWDNHDGLQIPQIHRAPSPTDADDERDALTHVEQALQDRRIAAVWVEPLHGTTLGREASAAFHRSLRALTEATGTLLIYDEVLTGFHRTGPKFRFMAHDLQPDLVVFGKACGNGFPVAGVARRHDVRLDPRMLLGSTFSNHALAATAVDATIACLEALDPERRVADVERIVLEHLGWLTQGASPRLRGAGALWVLALDDAEQAKRCLVELYDAGVCAGHHGRQIRLLPAVTIDTARLARACAVVAEVVRRVMTSGAEGMSSDAAMRSASTDVPAQFGVQHVIV